MNSNDEKYNINSIRIDVVIPCNINGIVCSNASLRRLSRLPIDVIKP